MSLVPHIGHSADVLVVANGRPGARKTALGHKSDDTAQFYLSGFVAINCQSIVHNQAERPKLIKYATSMISKRNLLAPMPPRAVLSEVVHRDQQAPEEGSKINITGEILSLTPEKKCTLKRQAREKDYLSHHKDFFNRKRKPSSEKLANVGQDLPEQISKLTLEEGETSSPLRKPSRYL